MEGYTSQYWGPLRGGGVVPSGSADSPSSRAWLHWLHFWAVWFVPLLPCTATPGSMVKSTLPRLHSSSVDCPIPCPLHFSAVWIAPSHSPLRYLTGWIAPSSRAPLHLPAAWTDLNLPLLGCTQAVWIVYSSPLPYPATLISGVGYPPPPPPAAAPLHLGGADGRSGSLDAARYRRGERAQPWPCNTQLRMRGIHCARFDQAITSNPQDALRNTRSGPV